MRAQILDRIERAEARASRHAHCGVILFHDGDDVEALLLQAQREGRIHPSHGVLLLPHTVADLAEWERLVRSHKPDYPMSAPKSELAQPPAGDVEPVTAPAPRRRVTPKRKRPPADLFHFEKLTRSNHMRQVEQGDQMHIIFDGLGEARTVQRWTDVLKAPRPAARPHKRRFGVDPSDARSCPPRSHLPRRAGHFDWRSKVGFIRRIQQLCRECRQPRSGQ
jgi:hypothetical protein